MIRRPSFAVLIPLVLLIPALAALAAPQPYKKDAGPFAVAVVRYDWTDAARKRPVPVKIYFPEKGAGPFPVIVFSHGLSASREEYEYVGRHWASHGYVVALPTHLGSDDGSWNRAHPGQPVQPGSADLEDAMARPLDVSFVLDRLTAMNREKGPFRGRLNLNEIGMSGHSFGGWTTLAVAGQSFPGFTGGGRKGTLGDPRVKAAVAMSAPPAPRQLIERSYGSIRIPILHMTGTLDDSPVSETRAADRRIPFDHIQGVDQYLVIFEGGDHTVFFGRRPGGVDAKDPRFHDLIHESTTAFWDAYLKGDAAAKRWLAEGGFRDVMGKDGKLEIKRAGRLPGAR
jgi:predicted dienelactone hydrolase